MEHYVINCNRAEQCCLFVNRDSPMTLSKFSDSIRNYEGSDCHLCCQARKREGI